MSLLDYPEIKKEFDKLMAEKEKIVAKAKPLRDEYDKVRKKMGTFQDQTRELAAKIHEVERPRLAEIDERLSALARATGGKAMNS
jgi:uncharacterized coiled-coil DUF342 family protein